MNDHLKLSPAGANLIKHFEGCLEKKGQHIIPYRCPSNVLTIGFGHTQHHGRHFDATSRWTMEECNEAFLEDMEHFEVAVRRLVKVPLEEQYRFDALVSFCYNCGEGNLAKSTLLKKVNLKDWQGAAAEFKKWNKGGGKVLPGLVRRRDSESLLFQGIKDDNYDGKPDKVVASPAHPMPQAVDEPEENIS